MKRSHNFEYHNFESFKKGEDAAFTYYYDRYFARIVGFCYQFIHNEVDSENLAQEAFINLWQKREIIDSVNGIQSFLFTYSKSKCLNFIRDNKVKDLYQSNLLNQMERDLDTEILNSISFDSLEIAELEDLINSSIEGLSSKNRTVFVKKRFENKKNAEIAQELGITIKAVEAHFTKALKILKNDLSSYWSLVICIFL